MQIDFVAWVQEELDRRQWKSADLMRAGRISDSQVSRVLNRERAPGRDFLEGVARAFKVPLWQVYVAAGWLPDHGDLLPELAALGARLRALSPEQREAALAALEAALRVAEAGDRGRRAR